MTYSPKVSCCVMNGMVVSDGTFPVWRVAHRGNVLDELIAATLQMAERFEVLAAQAARMERIVSNRRSVCIRGACRHDPLSRWLATGI